MKNTNRLLVIKHIMYGLLMLLLFIIQSTPELFMIRGAKPILVIPAAIVIAMLEGEFVGGIYGAAAGLLCDVGGSLLFGFNGLIVAFCCIVSGLLIIYLMRCNLLTCLLFTFFALMLRGGLDYFFSFGMWGFENSGWVYANFSLPAIIYTTAVTPLVYWLASAIFKRFALYGDEKL